MFEFNHKHHIQPFLNEVCSRDYPMMLSVFSNLLTKESDLRVIDNLCAALCRMILSNVEAVPLEQVFLQLNTSDYNTADHTLSQVGN